MKQTTSIIGGIQAALGSTSGVLTAALPSVSGADTQVAIATAVEPAGAATLAQGMGYKLDTSMEVGGDVDRDVDILTDPGVDPDAADHLLAPAELRHSVLPAALHGARLDVALVHCAPEFSRSYLQQLLAAGLVLHNGAVARKAAHKVRAADHISIELKPTEQSQAFRPEAMELDVVYEDAYLLVLNKPANLVVHPAPGNWSGTLLNGLLARHPDFTQLPRAGIVHRLDKDTSGLMVVARQRGVMDALVQQIAARQVSRQYLALAHNPWSAQLGQQDNAQWPRRSVQEAIGRDPRNRLRMAVLPADHAGAKPAQTDFIGLDSTANHCLVQCILHTGRTHQIRVHMASIGHPLVADTTYGGQVQGGLLRQGLHATRLALQHPATKQWLEFTAPVPADMASAMHALALRYNGLQIADTQRRES